MTRYLEPILGYAAVLDDDVAGADIRPTLSAAEKDAASLRGHPARTDRRIHRHGGRVELMAVARDEWTGELRRAESAA